VAVVVALASCLLLLLPSACASRADALTQPRATPGWGTRARTLLEEAEEEADDLEGDDPEEEQNMEDEVEDAEADDGVEVRSVGMHARRTRTWHPTPCTAADNRSPNTMPHPPGAAVPKECLGRAPPRDQMRVLGEWGLRCR